jgi:hypothetical protein
MRLCVIAKLNGLVPSQLMNVAVNPRDVAYCFVSYAKKIHAKVSVHDPNFVKLSIACGKVSLSS